MAFSFLKEGRKTARPHARAPEHTKLCRAHGLLLALTQPRSVLRSCPAYVCELAALKEISMQIVGWMLLLLLIVARPALAAFEGYIEMTMTMKEGSGT